ncbi:hypothetical protein PUN28_016200 [Cardiocondyla obscurior]|uniref:Uncharacterized protein n=1 Tax=Cardiocondyla obscurior TaxID=286306 RepID=A0AAW2ETR9_9HYME
MPPPVISRQPCKRHGHRTGFYTANFHPSPRAATTSADILARALILILQGSAILRSFIKKKKKKRLMFFPTPSRLILAEIKRRLTRLRGPRPRQSSANFPHSFLFS